MAYTDNPLYRAALEQAGWGALSDAGMTLAKAGAASPYPTGFGSGVGQAFGMFGRGFGDRRRSALEEFAMQQKQEQDDLTRQAQARLAARLTNPGGDTLIRNPQMASADPNASGAPPTFDVAQAMRDPGFLRDMIGASGGNSLGVMGMLQKQEVATPKVEEFFDAQGRPYKANFVPGRGWVPVGSSKTDLLSPEALAQKKDIQAAGKPSVDVKVDTKMGESLAKPIGEMVQQSRDSALGAIDMIDTTARIRGAMEGASLGPGASIRQIGDRIANAAGLGGATTEERLSNTRQVVKGLAELSLSARKSLKGQGQVSDYEGRLLEKAASGDIDSLSVPELKTILDVTDKLAKRQYSLHEQNMKALEEGDYKSLAPFYRVPALPQPGQSAPRATPPAAAAAPPNVIGRWNPTTGKVEPY